MNHLRPIKQLPTHEVENMPPYIGNQDLWKGDKNLRDAVNSCLLYTSPSPRDLRLSRMPSSA